MAPVADVVVSEHRAGCWKFPAKVRRVVDGDTIVLDIDQGRGQWWHGAHIRLAGIDCPEIHCEAGVAARQFVSANMPPGSGCYVQTHSMDNFGRWLATVWAGEAERPINQVLVETGHAIPRDWK